MNTLEKFLLFAMATAVFLLAGQGAHSNARRAELEVTVAQMKEDLGITVSKNWARDTWMREHQGELMQRIEKRIEP